MTRVLRRCVLGGVALLLFAPLVVAPALFFPFITGKNFFVRIVIDVIVGLYGALAILDARYRPKWSRILGALGAFTVALSLATIFGVDPYRSFWSNYERMEGLVTILHMFALFVVVANTVRGRNEWKMLIGVSLVVSFLSAIYGFFQMTRIIDIVGEGRPAAGFGNSIYFSVYLMFHMMIFGYLAVASPHVTRWWHAVGGLFLGVVFFASGSRGALLGFLAALAVVIIWKGIAAESLKARSTFGGALVVGVLFITLMFAFPKNSLVRSVPLLNRFFATNIIALGSDSRVLIWEIGIDGFTHRPVLGWGPGNFIVPFSLYYNSALFTAEPWFDRTHNMFVEWLVTAGIVGFLAYISIFVAWGMTIRSLLRSRAIEQSEAMLLSALAIGYGVQNAFVFDNITTYIFIALFSAYLVTRSTDGEGIYTASHAGGSTTMRISGAGIAVIAGIVLAIALNAKPLVVSAKLITSLNGFGENLTAAQIQQQFADTIALGTFGQTEVRERLADTLMTLSTKGEVSEQFIELLDYSISEYEKELSDHEPTLRDVIFTGKLYTIRYVVSKKDASRERAYQLYNRAIAMAPNYIQGRLGLAEIAAASGDYVTAKEQARISYEKVQNKDGIFYPAVSVFLITKDVQEANALLADFINPARFTEFDQTGSIQVISRALGALSPAERLSFLETYEKAWRNYHPHGIIYLALAQTYGEIGRLNEAIAMANRAKELSPEYTKQVDEFLKAVHAAR